MESLWERRPHVADWLRQIRSRPSYDAAITAYFTEADQERFNFPREETTQRVRDILSAN